MGICYLGTQGFSYKDWVGTFYPARTRPADYLAHYVEHFRAVELDSTQYGTPHPATVHAWYENTPPDFVFCAKFPRTITHDKKLIDAGVETREFLDALHGLREKCGPLLLQFSFEFTPASAAALDRFLGTLPGDFRYVVEFRHKEWLQPSHWEMLARHRAGLCLHDLYYATRRAHATTDFAYIRWLGNRKQLTKFDRLQIDRGAEQAWWGSIMRAFLAKGTHVYGFVNNCWAGHAPASVRQLWDTVARPVRVN